MSKNVYPHSFRRKISHRQTRLQRPKASLVRFRASASREDFQQFTKPSYSILAINPVVPDQTGRQLIYKKAVYGMSVSYI